MTPTRHLRRGLLAATLGFASFATYGQMPDARQTSLQQQLELCRAGQTWETTQACIAETLAANQARRTGQLESAGNYTANALARCNVHRDQENALACRARMMGLGQIEGSVASGGLLRSFEYQVPAEQAMAGVQAETPTSTQRMGAPGVALQQYEPMEPILRGTPAFPMY